MELVSLEDIYQYIAPFHARGEGSVRDSALTKVEASLITKSSTLTQETKTDLVVSALHPTLGHFRITFYDAKLSDHSWSVRGEDLEDLQETLPTIEHGTWVVADTFSNHYGSAYPLLTKRNEPTPTKEERAAATHKALTELAQNPVVHLSVHNKVWVGTSQVKLTAAFLTIEREALDLKPGACKACGSTEFTATLSASFPVVAVGQDTFETAAIGKELLANITLSNRWASLVCSSCGTKHHSGEPFYHNRLNVTLAGHKFSSGGYGEGSLTIVDLYNA